MIASTGFRRAALQAGKMPLSIPIIEAMTDNDLLIITADHGCDPCVEGTDHTREKVPCLVYSKKTYLKGNLGELLGFDNIVKFIKDWFE